MFSISGLLDAYTFNGTTNLFCPRSRSLGRIFRLSIARIISERHQRFECHARQSRASVLVRSASLFARRSFNLGSYGRVVFFDRKDSSLKSGNRGQERVKKLVFGAKPAACNSTETGKPGTGTELGAGGWPGYIFLTS